MPFYGLTVRGPAEATPPPPETFPVEAVSLEPLLLISKVYLEVLSEPSDSAAIVIEYPSESSNALDVKPSKFSVVLNRTVSPVLLPFPGSVTVMTLVPEEPDLYGLNCKRTTTAGAARSGLGFLRA
jgi:hypothetical protein